MTEVRPIKSEADYEAALIRIEVLMENPSADTDDELDVLATLVEVYGEAKYPIDLPSPIDAILFRMDQQQLTRADMKAYIGSSAKVSEVLSGKRPLTLKMIRALNTHLGIPAEVLIGKTNATLPNDLGEIIWERFPVRQMAKQGWLKQATDLKDRTEEVMRQLINRAGVLDTLPVALYRKSDSVRHNARMDSYALGAWCLYVLAEARQRGLKGIYKEGIVDDDFLQKVAHLSVFEEGPKLAVEFLAQHGIALVFAQHLPKTYLDGAAMCTSDGIPVIGVTVRYDRIDNFWFCLLHELAHIGWHLSSGTDHFIDDLSLQQTDNDEEWAMENKADELAQDNLIPRDLWDAFWNAGKASPLRVGDLAQKAGVHPAIVAGRVRKESGNYRLLTQFVGSGAVRKQFEGTYWT